MTKYRFYIDRGGTFTDVVARDSQGNLLTKKLLSENPEQYKDAAIAGIRFFLGLQDKEAIPEDRVECVKMGTTVATNALLERKGERTLLLINEGLEDALRIGYQNRPDLFALHIELPEMLYDEVLGVPCRQDKDGKVIQAISAEALMPKLQKAREAGIQSVGIVLIHAYKNPELELQLEAICRQAGFTQVSLSHRTSPTIRMVERGDTTVADAYLSPVLRRYVDQVQSELGKIPLEFMQSSGNLADAAAFYGKDAILSGPAGGVVGMVQAGQELGIDKLIGFDMGGTSTDVCHYAGEYERSFQNEIAGVRIASPMLNVHTVAAGGGSILKIQDSRFQVGPESAGANPGPTSYRRNGPLAVTDCNVLLGKLNPEYFPKVFGPDADQSLDSAQVQAKFLELQKQSPQFSLEEIAEGFLKIAVENMAAAVKKISLEQGYDVREYTLCSFGGAGSQHACLVAEALGMRSILLHPKAGVLSAYGIGQSRKGLLQNKTVSRPLDELHANALRDIFFPMEEELRATMLKQGVAHAEVQTRLMLKNGNSEHAFSIPYFSESEYPLQECRQHFLIEHERMFGYQAQAEDIILDGVSIEVLEEVILDAIPPHPFDSTEPAENPQPFAHHPVYMKRWYKECPFYRREQLQPGQGLQGPAIILEQDSTIVLEPGWSAEMQRQGSLLLRSNVEQKQDRDHDDLVQTDPIKLEVFSRLFMSIAEQMGTVLARTAASVNIRERLDFSCAIFRDNGELVANAPHVPVHLGSMSESIHIVQKSFPEMQPGDAFVLNDPMQGGTHLPDVTIVKPIFLDHESTPAFFTAARGHHADIGGIVPGSMPASSTSLAQEGVILSPTRIAQSGELLEEQILQLLKTAEFPARNPEQNLADLKAQLAACIKGEQEIIKSCSLYGSRQVRHYMQAICDNAEECVRNAIHNLKDGSYVRTMDDGSRIQVQMKVDLTEGSVHLDFSGTSSTNAGNQNAPLSITRAAVLYCFRCLVEHAIPLNDGCMRPVQLTIPEGSMLNPTQGAAVVAGNVEVSQAVVDAVFGVLDCVAASQGTMNNLTFGNAEHQYYETLCGGSGAGPGFSGTDAVHTHMTNSRLTDPEVLEWRYPVSLECFRIRKHSGGAGAFSGGNGTQRRIRFHEDMHVNILSNNRTQLPKGAHGGMDGLCGQNFRVPKTSKEKAPLCSAVSLEIEAGEAIEVQTPGGGGWGNPKKA